MRSTRTVMFRRYFGSSCKESNVFARLLSQRSITRLKEHSTGEIEIKEKVSQTLFGH